MGERLTLSVDVGGGAVMTILNPASFEDGGLGWQLRYGSPEAVRFVAASVVESYDYLLSSEITTTEAIRRLRAMRHVRNTQQPEPRHD